MDGVGSLFLLYALDLMTPGAEMLVILFASSQSLRSGLGCACGISAMTLVYKISGALGLQMLSGVFGELMGIARNVAACSFLCFSVYLLKSAFCKESGEAKTDPKAAVGFKTWFIWGVWTTMVNPFSMAATLMLMMVALEDNFLLREALFIGCGMALLCFAWSCVVALVGRTAWVHILRNRDVQRGVLCVTAVVFICYAIRFFFTS